MAHYHEINKKEDVRIPQTRTDQDRLGRYMSAMISDSKKYGYKLTL